MEELSKRIVKAYPDYSHHFMEDKSSLAKELGMEYAPWNPNSYVMGGVINPSGKGYIHHAFLYDEFTSIDIDLYYQPPKEWIMFAPIIPPMDFADFNELKNGKISDKLYEFIVYLYEDNLPKINITHHDTNISKTYILGKDKIL